jgi:hypothetical protein
MSGRSASRWSCEFLTNQGALKAARRNLFCSTCSLWSCVLVTVPPHHKAVRHGGSDNLSVDCDFVLDGQLASPTNQRIKLSSKDETASFRVLDLGNESKMIVELDTEIFDDGCPGDDTVEHSDFADRSEMTLGKKEWRCFFPDSRRFAKCETMIPDFPQRLEDLAK